jgi:hypothetical protein
LLLFLPQIRAQGTRKATPERLYAFRLGEWQRILIGRKAEQLQKIPLPP